MFFAVCFCVVGVLGVVGDIGAIGVFDVDVDVVVVAAAASSSFAACGKFTLDGKDYQLAANNGHDLRVLSRSSDTCSQFRSQPPSWRQPGL